MRKEDRKYRKINKKKLSVSSHYSKLIKDSFDHKFPQYPLNNLTDPKNINTNKGGGPEPISSDRIALQFSQFLHLGSSTELD